MFDCNFFIYSKNKFKIEKDDLGISKLFYLDISSTKLKSMEGSE